MVTKSIKRMLASKCVLWMLIRSGKAHMDVMTCLAIVVSGVQIGLMWTITNLRLHILPSALRCQALNRSALFEDAVDIGTIFMWHSVQNVNLGKKIEVPHSAALPRLIQPCSIH